MKILLICHRFPYPPTGGAKIRPFHIIRHLAKDNRVTVCSLVRSDEEQAAADGIAGYCERYEPVRVHESTQALRMVARLPTTVPSSMGYFYSHRLAHRIRNLLASNAFDLILVHASSVAQYVSGISHIPKILDFCDMDSQKWLDYVRYKPFPLSVGYWLEGRKLERAERRLADQFDLCTTATGAELTTLRALGASTPSDWFPNGVDATYFAPVDRPHDPDTISFIGRMDYYPNQECMIEFCRNTLPLLRAQRPGIKLLIVGADPAAQVRRLSAIPGVTVTGTVPDVRPYVQRSAVSVAPLNIARGTQNKILEAMAMGVPVVTSRIAAGGVDAVVGEHILVGSDPGEYCQAILKVLADPGERQRLSLAGRARILSHHSWDSSMQRLDGIIQRACNAYSSNAASEFVTPSMQK